MPPTSLRGQRAYCTVVGAPCLPFRPGRARAGRWRTKVVTGKVAAQPTPEAPAKVVIGAYINDIQEFDFKTNSYAIDLYVWGRSRPLQDHGVHESLRLRRQHSRRAYDKPQVMPDGSLNSIIRYQGQFSTKFQLEKYPFDTQALLVVMEDTVAAADTQVYVRDPKDAVTINPDMTLPGFKIGKPELRIVERPYPTDWRSLRA
jgi:hypothetical protein